MTPANDPAVAVFTLRRSGWLGLRIASKVSLQWPEAFRMQPLGYVVFVHGYANSHKDARESYARFRWWLNKFSSRGRPRVIELHWPGDSLHWPGKSLYGLSSASYWRQVGRAVECARLLKEWIADAPEGARFILVAHSLGCRLVLETLKQLESDPKRTRVEAICLMAAAVPVSAIERSELGPVTNDRIKWNVLHSPSDWVLKGAFPLGQAAATDSFFVRAVGLTGEPKERWIANGNSFLTYETWKRKRRHYGHGWYWRGGNKEGKAAGPRGDGPLDPIRPPNDRLGTSAKRVANLLGVVTARTMEERLGAIERSIVPPREFWSRSVG